LLLLHNPSQSRLTFVGFHPTSANFHPTSINFRLTFINVFPSNFVGPGFSIQKVSQAWKGYSEHHRLKSCPSVSSFVGRYSDTPFASFTMGFYKIWKLVHFVGCVTREQNQRLLYNISKKLKLVMHTMKPIIWGLHHVQGLSLHLLR
jgi:hypothetical protein